MWAFVDDAPLADEERNQERPINANLQIVAAEVRWRLANGSLWTLKDERA